MKYYIHSLRTALASLIVAMIVTIGAGLPISAHAAPEKTDQTGRPDQAGKPDMEKEKKVKIRKEDERNLKGKSPFYVQQAKALAEQYSETATKIAQQGGNPEALLKAAAYFRSQAENLF